jgi:zinc and cadmium transporter
VTIPTLFLIICASIAGGALSLLIAAALSFTLLSSWLPRMVSFAVGAMLAAAFLDVLPEAFQRGNDVEALFAMTLAGLLGFFLLEKAALWRHRHDHDVELATGPATHPPGRGSIAAIVLIGDGFHNAVDGVLIAAAFLADTSLGLTATLAIAAHEIPQEVGDFTVLLDCGLSRAQALVMNLLSSLTSIAGGIGGYFALEHAQHATPYVLALAGASFIYIAVADLIPNLHRATDSRSTLWQIALIAAGIATIALPHALLHSH